MQLHNELLTTMVMYIGRLAAAGQLPLLRQIGLSPPQIERIGRLSLAEMNELSTFGSHFMDIKVDAGPCQHWQRAGGEAGCRRAAPDLQVMGGFVRGSRCEAAPARGSRSHGVSGPRHLAGGEGLGGAGRVAHRRGRLRALARFAEASACQA